MPVRRKIEKTTESNKKLDNWEKELDKFISEGGSVPSNHVNQEESISKSDVKFILRVPFKLCDQIDKKRKGQVGLISRNTYILQLLEKALKQE